MPESRERVAVTGAASGIGKAIAELLEARGAEVVRLDRRECAGIRRFEVTSEADWAGLDDQHLTGLVHAAGVRGRSALAETSLDDFRRVLDVNTTGTFLALRWAARLPANAELRAVVTLSSAVVDRLPEDQLAYNASKAAINVLTRCAAKELAPRIRINAIAPGSIETPMTATGWTDEAHAERMRAEIPAARPGSPAEIASIAAFLLSEESSYVTGATLTADGGWSL